MMHSINHKLLIRLLAESETLLRNGGSAVAFIARERIATGEGTAATTKAEGGVRMEREWRLLVTTVSGVIKSCN